MLVLIGGGDLKTKTTKQIDEFIISKSNKVKPTVLFIPTAMKDSKKSINNFLESYDDISNVDFLFLYENPKLEDVKNKIDRADIIYVGGGNTLDLIKKWNEYDLANYIFSYHDKKIIAGISAGAICWFDKYLGDSEAFYDNGYCNFRIHERFGLIKGVCCPHYDEEGKDVFNSIMKKIDLPGYALENNTALVIDKNKKSVIKSKKTSSVYEFEPLNTLMRELK